MSRKPHQMLGLQFGCFLVISEAEDSIPKTKKFNVKCLSCGRELSMLGGNIRRHGASHGFGCKKCYQPKPKNPIFEKKHGLWNHPIYPTWTGMKDRCYNKNHKAYYCYGGRGIFVCDEWREDPKPFIQWMIDHNWKKGLQLDRRNNDLGYSPDNCRIVDVIVNANNRSNNHWITVHGEKLTISQASRKYKINKSTIRERIQRQWPNDDLVKAVIR